MNTRNLSMLFCVMMAFILGSCVTLPAQYPPGATPGEVDLAPTLPPGPPQTPTPRDSSAPKEELPLDLPQGAAIVFKRSGGLAGVDETWVIYFDGRITAADGAAYRTDEEAVNALLDQLRALDLAKFAGDYTPLNPCCDRFFYELFLNVDATHVLIKTADGASDVPEAVWQAIDLVSAFIAAHTS